MSHPTAGGRRDLLLLSLGALGIVYGDIGTSPLYTIKEAFFGHFHLPVDRANVLGVLSLIIWAIVILIIFKYLTLLVRVDHQGQGGILALLTLVTAGLAVRSRRRRIFVIIGLFGAALIYGDGVLTPAISVVSAVEGLAIAAPGLSNLVVPLAVVILIGLFLVQRRGTGSIGVVFGPVILLWMVVMALLGLRSLLETPEVVAAFDPRHAVAFFVDNGRLGFFVLSAVVLAVTGGEALYADLGHFGKNPIRLSWYTIVCPALLLNYLGQGALLLRHPEGITHPFYELAPTWFRLPLILLATCAAVIASQALISAAFSLTQQLVNLGYIPRVKIIHTSATMMGQIYVPSINTLLMVACVLVVILLRTSSALAGAYGLSITITMAIDSLLFFFAVRKSLGWALPKALALVGLFLSVELALMGANFIKIAHGGWFPLVVGGCLYLLMSTWRRGRLLLGEAFQSSVLELEPFLKEVGSRNPPRVPGTAVFMTREASGVPPVLLHHLKHNEVLHKRVLLLSVVSERVPWVPKDQTVEIHELDRGFFRMVLRHGFLETPNVTQVLKENQLGDKPFDLNRTTFYFGRETILPTGRGKMATWRKKLFGIMARNANPATSFFNIPPNRVVELGTQVAL